MAGNIFCKTLGCSVAIGTHSLAAGGVCAMCRAAIESETEGDDDSFDRDLCGCGHPLRAIESIDTGVCWNCRIKMLEGADAEQIIAAMAVLPDRRPDHISMENHAANLVNDGGDRNTDYGHPRENFGRIAQIWNGLLSAKLKDGEQITAHDVGLFMIGVKMAREAHKPKQDNRTDICGYAICLDRLEETPKEGNENNGSEKSS